MADRASIEFLVTTRFMAQNLASYMALNEAYTVIGKTEFMASTSRDIDDVLEIIAKRRGFRLEPIAAPVEEKAA